MKKDIYSNIKNSDALESFFELSSKGSNTLILDLALLIKVNFSIKKGR